MRLFGPFVSIITYISFISFACFFIISPKAVYGEEMCDCQAIGTKDGFHAMAIITDDNLWQEKWETSPETIPQFNTVSTLSNGDSAMLLVFFSNPMIKEKMVDISCDLKLIKPDGIVTEHGPTACFSQELQGRVENVRMAGLRVGFEIDQDDPRGIWDFEIGVRDMHRNVRIPLKVSLNINDKGLQIE